MKKKMKQHSCVPNSVLPLFLTYVIAHHQLDLIFSFVLLLPIVSKQLKVLSMFSNEFLRVCVHKEHRALVDSARLEALECGRDHFQLAIRCKGKEEEEEEGGVGKCVKGKRKRERKGKGRETYLTHRDTERHGHKDTENRRDKGSTEREKRERQRREKRQRKDRERDREREHFGILGPFLHSIFTGAVLSAGFSNSTQIETVCAGGRTVFAGNAVTGNSSRNFSVRLYVYRVSESTGAESFGGRRREEVVMTKRDVT